jgi:hypothetical protein
MSHGGTLALIALFAAAAIAATALGQAGTRHRFCASSIRGKFDSDQRRDVAVVYSTRRRCDTVNGRSWYLVVRLASGGGLRRPLGNDRPAFASESDFGCDTVCAVRAVPDFNRDGRHEIEVSLQQGATTEQRGIYGVVRGKLRRLTGRPGDKRFSFSYGGSVRYGSFVVCRARAHMHIVAAVGWGLSDDAHSSVDESIYTFDGLHFRLIGRKTYRVAGARVPPRVSGRPC